ncbi:tetratricopeptide repeat protein [Leptolyngbya sp. FACHB-671]|uniref:tetratricopeptide repeat protein n=1 Tax=Leptolyngbya sp. FACHB-671 TaxID=2692812 RepID=UPI0016821945|nr:tetratricopeptide repeat protein [Leptolyngbya sp. FACHB-671]MBD2071105.1 tetratricopeptide repeat protein [Leptolyngbya sp. FACHB-671]
MNRWLQPKKLGFMLAMTVAFGGSLLALPRQAHADEIFRQQGTIQPAQNEYTFSGTEGQTVTINLTSADFDTTLALVGPGEQEIAFNDDFGGSLNSRIIATLPSNGEYRVIVRSFAGNGGAYTVTVNPATEYEQAYASATTLYQAGSFTEAIAAFGEAIEIDPVEPSAYIDRGNAYLATGENTEAAIADFERAADLYEERGEVDSAQSYRDYVQFLQSSPPPEPMPF